MSRMWKKTKKKQTQTSSFDLNLINLMLFPFFLIPRQNLVSVIMNYRGQVEYLLQNEVFVLSLLHQKSINFYMKGI